MALSETYETLQVGRYFNVAGASILLYDHILASEWEIQYYSQSRWGVPKVVFIICRYLPYPGVAMAAQEIILSFISSNPFAACPNLSAISSRGNIIRACSIVSAEVLLCIRIWILWDKSKRILITLVVLAGLALPLALFFNLVPTPVLAESTPSQQAFCEDQGSKDASIVNSVIMAYEIALFSLVSLKWKQLRRTMCANSIAYVLVKDCIMYTSGIIAISAAIVITGFAFPAQSSTMFESLQLTLHSGMACRTMLNLVKNRKQVEYTTTMDMPLVDMAFAAHRRSDDFPGAFVTYNPRREGQ